MGSESKMPEETVLDRASPLPLFLQIRQQLMSEILAWPEADRRFPTEMELTQRFGVSKMTIRQAIEELVSGGFLTRRRGQGTFVTDSAFVERLTPALDIDQQYAQAGKMMTATVLSVTERQPTEEEVSTLPLEMQGKAREKVLVLRRVREVGGSPAALDERVMPVSLARKAGFNEMTAKDSIIARLRKAILIVRARWTMTARLAGPELATLLVVNPTDPMMQRAMRYYDEAGQAVMMGTTIHRSDRLACEVELDLTSQE